MPIFTLKDVQEHRSISPKRFRFSDNPAVRNHEARGHHIVGPKFPSLKRLFKQETGIDTLDGPYGPYKFLTDAAEIASALAWQDKHKSYVFLRDNLDCAMAFDFNLAEAGVYTEFGQAEHDAKASKSEAAIAKLSAGLAGAIANNPFYSGCEMVCAVPPSPEKDWDLPTELAKRVAAATKKIDISADVKFQKKKQSVKALSLDDKWKALEAAQLIAPTNVKGKKIILIDDKYQSGTTAQYVAMKLFEMGAKEVHGLFCVKTWRDTDNT
ncbi:MAG: hypothetical protein HY242_09455 [Afipia sp.]|nr:hypothetical protein [Afipia sp.]